MKKTAYHILNGDALKDQLGDQLDGEVIVVREGLVDGPVTAVDLEDLYRMRATFINDHYTPISWDDYRQKVVSEFLKIEDIPAEAEVNMWFEDDLFCQVNMWFVLHLLAGRGVRLYLVRPLVHTRYGFGGLSRVELMDRLEHRIQFDPSEGLYDFWNHYQSGALDELRTAAAKVQDAHPYMIAAVEAHIDRIPTDDTIGKPLSILKDILEDIGGEDFDKIYQAFSQRAPIYGYGDLQVRKLLRGLNNSE